jgi:hypothetical protein
MKPLAWYDPTNGMVSTDKDSPLFTPLGQLLPLFSQRTWVGLTVEEIEAIGKPAAEKDGSIQAWGLFALAIEAKLKEKNT